MFKVDDIWQPKTKTEHKILQNMKEERKLRPMMFQCISGLTPQSNELKEIENAYHNYKELSSIRGSDLDLELLLEYVRPIVEVFEKKAEQPGQYQDFCKGIMDACRGFLHQIICMHEAKTKLKRDLLEEAKQEARDRERESKL